MAIRDIIVDAAIIGMSAALLWHFSNIWRYGQCLIQEPNIAIRSLETAGIVAILAWGISRLMSDLKRKKK